jgi:gamma-glutamylputrescine oxidase
MLTRLLAGAGVATGLVSAAIHRQWLTWEDELEHPDGANLGGTGMTAYSLSGATKESAAVRPALATNVHTPYDVCVIGGGFAGLHAALALAERGKKVVVLEGKRIGSGASGRNGGDAVIGFHEDVASLARWTGSAAKARELFAHSEAGYERLRGVIAKYRIQCDAKEHGALTVGFATERRAPSDAAAAAEVTAINDEYGQRLQFKDRDAIAAMGFVSPRYRSGVLEPRNLTLNPLELCFGLARACEANGVAIFENSKVLGTKRDAQGSFVVTTALGAVRAKQCVLATNHAPASISRRLAMRTAPISTSMMVTQPLPKAALDACLATETAVFDNRFGLAYFRRIAGDRIVYGCFASGLPMSASQSAARKAQLVADLTRVFPTLEGSIKVERWWTGRLQSQFPVFPLVGRDASTGMYYSLGFAGHGIVPTCGAAILVASAICDGDMRIQLWDEVVPRWLPAGGPTGYIGASLACVALQYYDKACGRF